MSLAELARLAETEAEALEDLPALFVLMDSEGFRRGDGSLTLEEWLAYAEDMPELREEHFGKALGAQLESAFAKPAAKRIGPLDRKARCEALFDEIDVDGNGYIDLKEYIAGMTTRAGGEPLSAEDEEEAQLERPAKAAIAEQGSTPVDAPPVAGKLPPGVPPSAAQAGAFAARAPLAHSGLACGVRKTRTERRSVGAA